MYKLTIFLGLAVLANANQHRTYENPSCPDDKVWDQCGDPCPVTCEDVKNNTTIKPCPKICLEAACVCETGKAIDNNGQCVTFQTCLAKSYQYHQSENVLDCREGEIFNECGDACEVTCDDVDNNRLPKPCPLICGRPACVCVDDKARNHRGDCVTYRQCMLKKKLSLQDIIEPNGQDRNENTENRRERNQNRQEWRDRDENQRCGRNEEFKECGTTCPKTCLNKHILNPWCTNDCAVNVCQCKDGYVSNLEGVCVEPEACPNRWNLQESNSEEEQNERRCGENEILKECGTRCEKTCRNYFHDIGCIQECVPNVCQCQQGYVRDDSKKCVAISQCPRIHTEPQKQCNINEEFNVCGTACEKTCRNPKSKFCPEICVMNVCQCKDGFVRNQSGICIRLEQCPQIDGDDQNGRECGTNEIWTECGTACEKTCRNFFIEIPCTKQCIPNVCRCKPGHVRYNRNRCVAQTQCPRTNTDNVQQQNERSNADREDQNTGATHCWHNEYFSSCGRSCEKTCETWKDKHCTLECQPEGCTCKRGYVRENERCVPVTECRDFAGVVERYRKPHTRRTQHRVTEENGRSAEQEREGENGETPRPPYWKCPLNEFYNPCGNKCESTCKNMLYPDWQCTKICERGACQCESGFVRNERGVCVLPTHCPKEEIKCPKNEEVDFCGNLCERKCRHVAEGTITVCPLICKPPACVCKPGYARFHNEGRCVLENHCLV